ncbi:hypothetical protein QWY99_19850 [Flavobacterium branchiarum]|uniref:Uncharacterized protein n=1 Tax=Flavobacterium branchiarum TaxID=1114870 RepID=A0ABV5FG42_9FLAO|nr:hypothetical protein [Flavobacterium branchiarum]MDN3675290.1 hypothetical protein [Flavobacterium branchiarum]
MKYFSLLFLLVCVQSFSQNVSLRWSDKFKSNGNEVIVGGKSGNYYTRNTTKDNNLIFKTFDDKAVLRKESDADFKLAKIEYEYVKNYFLGKDIIHILSEHKRKKKTLSIYASKTNKDFEPIDETMVLSEVNYKDMVKYGVKMSPDSTKIVVWTELKGKKKSKPNSIEYKIFDTKLKNVLKEKTVILPQNAEDMRVYNCLIDDYLNFYVNSQITKPKKEQKKEESETYYSVFVYGKNDELKNIACDYKNKFIDSYYLNITKDNTLICTGFLSPIIKGFLKSKKREMVSDEIFIVKNDCKTLAEKENKVISVSSLYPEKVSKVSEYVPYKVREVHELNDGSLSIVAEQYKAVYHSGYKGNGYFVYYYCDIAVINLDNKSQVKGMVKIPKYQQDVRNPSLLTTTYKGKTYVVYEDETKNDNVNTDKEIKKSTSSIFSRDKNNSLFLVTVNAKGEMKKEIIYSYDKSEIRSNFSKCEVIKDGEIMLNANDYIGILKIK